MNEAKLAVIPEPSLLAADRSDERTFLHDIASPLGAAMFALDGIIETLDPNDRDPGEAIQLAQVAAALEKIKKLLSRRSELLIRAGVPSARR